MGGNFFHRMVSGKDVKYDHIWKSIYPCVEKCLLSNFRDIHEMLHCNRWCIVHVTCRNIILKHMKILHITDPHEFDKVVCWKVVKEGWDRDPKWRCICAFFLAAAMEVDMVKRFDETKFKKVDKPGKVGRAGDGIDHDTYREFLEIVQRIERMYSETHQKVSETHQTMQDIHTRMFNHPGIPASNPAIRVAQSSVHIYHQPHPESTVDANRLFQSLLSVMRTKSSSKNSTPNSDADSGYSSQFPEASAPPYSAGTAVERPLTWWEL